MLEMMVNYLKKILDWSEVWALFIPLGVLLWRRSFSSIMMPIVVYILLAIVLNFAQDYILEYAIKVPFTRNPGENTFIYNTHSIVRLLLFSWFFIQLKQPLLATLKILIPVLFTLFVIVNFYRFEKYIDFSSLTLALEAVCLLIYCLLYYFALLQQEQSAVYRRNPEFWIVTGLSIYVVINFPIFLFYTYLFKQEFEKLAINIWYVHNVAYIFLCIFIAKAFYESKR